MYNVAAEYSFLRMLAQLEANVRVLDQHFDTFSPERLEREINTANAFLSSLWDKMRTDSIDPYRVHSTLSNIEFALRSLQLRAQTRRSTPDSFWGHIRSALSFVVDAINFVTSLIGLGRLIPRIPSLPFTGAPKLLEYNSADDDGRDSD